MNLFDAMASLVGERNTVRGFESIARDNRRQIADRMAENDPDVTQAEAYDALEDAEDEVMDRLGAEVDDMAEPVVRIMIHKNFIQHVKDKEE